MPFDPDAYLAKKRGFDPDEYLKPKVPDTARADVTAAQEPKPTGGLTQAILGLGDYPAAAVRKPKESLLGLIESIPAMKRAPTEYTVYPSGAYPSGAEEGVAPPSATYVHPEATTQKAGEFPTVEISEEEKKARATGRFAGHLGQAFVAPQAVPAQFGAKGKFALQSLASSAPYIMNMLTSGDIAGAGVEATVGLAFDALLQGLAKVPKPLARKVRHALAARRAGKEAVPSAKTIMDLMGSLSQKEATQLDNVMRESVEESLRLTKAGKEAIPPGRPSAAVGKAAKKGIRSTLDAPSRSVLAEPTAPRNTPFDKYVEIGREAAQNPRNQTEFDVAGSKGVEALNTLTARKRAAGQAKNAVLTQGGDTRISVADFKEVWRESLAEKTGAMVWPIKDEAGRVAFELTEAPLRGIRKPSEENLIKRAASVVENLSESPTIQQLDDTKSALWDLVQGHKASMVRPQRTATEAAIQDSWKVLDDKLKAQLGDAYADANKQYATLIEMEQWLNKRLGEVVDPATGITRHGASLMKSAVQSNADRGTKAMFERIRKTTGIDLFQEAKYAEISMLARGDQRAFNLLEGMYKASGLAMPGPLAKARGATGLLQVITGRNATKEALEFYVEQQKKAIRPQTLSELLEGIRAGQATPTRGPL